MVFNGTPTSFDCEAVTTRAPLYYPDTLVNPDTCLVDFVDDIALENCQAENIALVRLVVLRS